MHLDRDLMALANGLLIPEVAQESLEEADIDGTEAPDEVLQAPPQHEVASSSSASAPSATTGTSSAGLDCLGEIVDAAAHFAGISLASGDESGMPGATIGSPERIGDEPATR